MHSLTAATRNELFKTAVKKRTVVFFIFAALVPVLTGFLLDRIQGVIGIMGVSEAFPIDVLQVFTLFIIPLYIMMSAVDLFPGEVSSRTLKLSLLRPVTRFKVFSAKTISIGIGIAAMLLLSGVIAFICGLVFSNTGSSGFIDTAKAYGAAFVPMMALCIAAVFVTQFFRSASSAIIFLIILFMVAKILPIFFHSASAFSLASYTDWHMLWLGSGVSFSKIFSTLLFLLSSSVLLFTAGYYMFDKKEF